MQRLHIHGIGIEVQSDWPSALESLRHDFTYFVHEKPPTVHLKIRIIADTRPIQHWRSWFSTARSTLFHGVKGEARVCFFERAWIRYRFEAGTAEIYCEDETISYEACYLTILSFVGESLDRRGLHRIHGFGFGIDGEGGVVLAASGTGKSTLALGLLKKGASQILSDDTPLLSPNLELLPFPQRIAIKEDPEVDSKFVRKFSRVKYGEKYVVGSDYFRDKIPNKLPARWLVLANRNPKKKMEMIEVKRSRLIWPLFKWLVIGYETPQIWELYLRPSFHDLVYKAKIFVSRLRLAIDLYKNSRIVVLNLNGKSAECADQFSSFFVEQKKAG